MPSLSYVEGGLLRRPATAPEVLHAFAAPLIAVAMLWLCLRLAGQTMDSPHLLLAALTFALAYPGRPPRGSGWLAAASSVAAGWLLVLAGLLLLGWLSHTLTLFDWRWLTAWAVATPLAQLAFLRGLPWMLPVLTAAEGGPRVAVVVGQGHLGRRLAAALAESPTQAVRIAGYFDDRLLPRAGAPVEGNALGTLDRLAEYVRRHPVDLIYITLPMVAQPRILRLLDELRDTTASVYFTPDLLVADPIQARLDAVGGVPLVAVCETPLYGIAGPLKRASDLVLGTLILLMIAPLMLAVAVAIRWESPGPVIFRQRRYGLDGREIVVYKFRSMRVAEDGETIRQATRNDDRVTRVGAFIRRTSLDELPQFINVLQGRMSIVGPRPHAVAHNEMYRKLIRGYMLRHKVRPGITGWAQVNGLRGETETLEKMQRRVEFDLEYLRHWSLRWDLEIILRTLVVAWKKDNAY